MSGPTSASVNPAMDSRFSLLLQQLQEEHESKLSSTKTELEATRSELRSTKKTLTSTQHQLRNALARIQILERRIDGSSPDKRAPQFLDLPPEIRNQIYEEVAASAFSVPVMVAYSPTSPVEHTLGRKKIHQASVQHDSQRGPAQRRRLAMLYTCRQIYREASLMFYGSMTLDLRFITLDVVRPDVRALNGYLGQSLQHIRHIEIEHRLLDNLLEPMTRQLDWPREHWNGKKWIVDHEKYSADAHDRYWRLWRNNTWLDETSPATIKQFLRLRTNLFSIESITAYQDFEDEECVDRLGVDFMYKLACIDSMPPSAIPRLFPNLVDVKLISEFGSERFRRVGQVDWELWYCHEKLQDSYYAIDDVDDESLSDPVTGLIVKTTQAP
ncbi:hypothetical protein CLAFUW4_11298 [Fulvia fulva]|uniref:uncharacterized protein n=1 Tax=Passalora fulva TaxID=5499 RepID=UPI0028526366|nr:uncharacterized protein CLAFUR5_20311 [Fulvia fulva]KAK4619703.1 hypothetical protein CLAFUR4_11304 [Fulvia fulva]KAK4620323.1 hypothetical protein CLAFUR0_11309 [Fulvia fulva]WMI38958.1 hypothetical protein CLAFUR5_20311 [Fulvia fulva]WPV16995.1 hypothetical protein CLAFUW4_11298 [Fulvia fulva]WPV32648.1 hypothetical protein CLAFUW7_11294 [Fulvia fulva]